MGEFSIHPFNEIDVGCQLQATRDKGSDGASEPQRAMLGFCRLTLIQNWLQTFPRHVSINYNFSMVRWWTNDPSMGLSTDTAQVVFQAALGPSFGAFFGLL